MDHVKSNVEALKNLIAIIMGIAISNIVVATGELALGREIVPQGDEPFQPLASGEYVLLGIVLVVLAVRFYHGNVRALDEAWHDNEHFLEDAEGRPIPRLRTTRWTLFQAIDLLVIVIQGGIFLALGIVLFSPVMVWRCLFFLLLLDGLLFATIFMSNGGSGEHRVRWVVVNGISLLALCSQLLFFLSFMKVVAAVVLVGSVADYVANRHFYFPAADDVEDQ